MHFHIVPVGIARSSLFFGAVDQFSAAQGGTSDIGAYHRFPGGIPGDTRQGEFYCFPGKEYAALRCKSLKDHNTIHFCGSSLLKKNASACWIWVSQKPQLLLPGYS